MSNKLKQLRAKEGFTIIEVIIVLVIGAVIMLAVFLVVPQLQRTQRNSARQNSARRVLTAAEQVNANTASFPEANGTGKTAIEAITGTIKAPNGSDFSWLYAQTGAGVAPDNNTIYYTNNTSTCASNSPTATPSSGKVVVIVANEGASTSTNWCVGN